MVSRRLESIEEYATLRMTNIVKEFKSEGHDVIRLRLGE